MTVTYSQIATQTLGSAAATVTFSSIPATYTDLVLVATVLHTTASTNTLIQFNNDTGTNYSSTYAYGTGSVAGSGRGSNATSIPADYSDSTTNFSMFRMNIMNYANTTTNKTVISRNDEASTQALMLAGLWRSTSAISSIQIKISGGNLGTGSTFSLYGIKAE